MTSRRLLAIFAAGVLALSTPVQADTIPNPGDAGDANMYVYWEYDFQYGAAELYLENVGSESRNQFEWTVPDLTFLDLPNSYWSYSYNPDTDVVTLTGNLNPGPEDGITVYFEFDPADKQLRYGDLDYWGPGTSGTLHNIGIIVPEPATLTFLVIGASALIRRRKK